jgi:geranylgeranylglycerol-phosphate geranylgeranyltransferase
MSLVTKIVAWLKIVRPPIIFISCLGAIVGTLNAAIFLNFHVSNFQIFMVILGAGLLSSGLMVHNDVTDLKSDKINRPHKPLPSGKIKIKTAYFAGLLLMIFSIIVALFVNYIDQTTLNWNCAVFTAILVIVGIYYNHYGKYHGLLGHVAVAFGVGAIPYWGSIAVFSDKLILMLPLALAIFAQEIGREIMVCAGDFTGDLKSGFKTIPVLFGRKKSMYISLFFYLLYIPLYPLPAYDYLKLGIPQVFGTIYLIGGGAFGIVLILTWLLTYRVVLKGDEKKIWVAFEKYERTGTRIMIIIFQLFLLLEVFY